MPYPIRSTTIPGYRSKIRVLSFIRQSSLTIVLMIVVSGLHAQIPLLNSFPSARATVYLDFDGQYVAGTIWNEQGPIDAQRAALSPADITEIYNRVSDDYRPFNINITTDENVYRKAPVQQRERIIFTPTSYWYRNAGGVSCVGSFTWGDDSPAWVFTDWLGNSPRRLAASASHEIGHTMGLQHQSLYDADCHKITEYSGGGGTLATGWAPIMGIGYYKNCITWCTGSCTAGCDSIQSDIEVIAGSRNQFGFRSDDHGNDQTNATDVNIYDHLFSIKGMINYPLDRDAFRLDVDSRKELRVNVMLDNPSRHGKTGAIRISLLKANGDTVAGWQGSPLLYEGIDIILDTGTYYFIVAAAGHNDRPMRGIREFYALSGALFSAGDLQQLAFRPIIPPGGQEADGHAKSMQP